MAACASYRAAVVGDFFYCGNKLWKGPLDFPKPHPGQMVAHSTGRDGDVAPLHQFGRYRAARGPSGSDDIDSKLLDKFCLHLLRDTIILLLSLPLVHQRERTLLIESAGKGCCMGLGQLQLLVALSGDHR